MIARPNVLIVMSDEQSWDTLGCNGNRAASTPHLDALAATATAFDHCYSSFPLCCPARTSLWTGLMPRHHGVLGNWRPIEPHLREAGLASAFSAGGYHTIYCGKWHVPGTTPRRMGWADASAIPEVLEGRDRGADAASCHRRELPCRRQTGRPRGPLPGGRLDLSPRQHQPLDPDPARPLRLPLARRGRALRPGG